MLTRTDFTLRALLVIPASILTLVVATLPARSTAPDSVRVKEGPQNKASQKAVAEKATPVRHESGPVGTEKMAAKHQVESAPAGIPGEWMKTLNWRCIGPANMGGRITAFTVYEADPTTYWVATASGGLLKTVNNGITFEHQFDKEGTVSIGDVCVAPSNREVVWLGTGEANPRNSVSYGDGIYKSTDGGKSWKHLGLEKSFQIGRIAIHPKNPDVVYVGALGRLYGPNEERGVYKTIDGGKTWHKVLGIDDKTGVIDLCLHPNDPETLLVAAWERQRDAFDDFQGPPPPEGIEHYDPVVKYGKAAGIYKSTDGGTSFHKLTKGLPTCAIGRIGLDYYRKDPKVVFAVVDTEKYGTGLPPIVAFLGLQGEKAPEGLNLTTVAPGSPAEKAGLKVKDLLVSVGGKATPTTEALTELLRSRKVGDKVKVAYRRGQEKKEAEVTLARRPQPGRRGGGGGGMFGREIPSPGFFGDEAEGGGVVVTRIFEGGPAEHAGLKIDDIVTAIDGKPITDLRRLMRQFMTIHKVGDTITLSVSRGADRRQLKVKLEAMRLGDMMGAEPTPPGRIKRPYASQLGGNRANVQDEQGPDGWQTGGVYRSIDGGESWSRVNSANPRPMYFSVIRVDPSDEKHLFLGGVQMLASSDGGKTFSEEAVNRGLHSDQHALWIDPRDGRHQLIGSDGGFYQTYDRCAHWDHLDHMAFGQFYHVAVDPRPLYRAFGGLQDNGSWGGPTRSLKERGPASGPVSEDWISIGGGDGFVCRVDSTDPDLVYSESQGGNIQRRNLRTAESGNIHPKARPGHKHRFNWNTPYILSSHNPSIFYCAGDRVYRSVSRGDHLKSISPEITRSNKGSATALAESPRNPDVLYVGSDDGALWVTRDGGAKWINIAEKIGLPGPRWVASIEASKYADGRAYVAFDAHRSDDDQPYLYVTEDFGQTWKSARGNLPLGSTRVCREDIENENLLYVGTEFAAWASPDRGQTWTKLNQKHAPRPQPTGGARGPRGPGPQVPEDLPTVAVHEFAQHPTSGEVVVATHGRSLWVVDVAPLRQMTALALKAKAQLYKPTPVILWHQEPGASWFGESTRQFIGRNPPAGAQIYYSLTAHADDISLKVVDYAGKTLQNLRVSHEPGLHLATWTMAREGQRPPGQGGPGSGRGQRAQPSAAAATGQPAPAGSPSAGPGPQREEPSESPAEDPGAGLGAFFGRATQIEPGTYRIVLTVGGKESNQPLRVDPDPTHPATPVPAGSEGNEEP